MINHNILHLQVISKNIHVTSKEFWLMLMHKGQKPILYASIVGQYLQVDEGVSNGQCEMHRLHDVLQFFATSLKNRIVEN